MLKLCIILIASFSQNAYENHTDDSSRTVVHAEPANNFLVLF